ncbi:MAG: peptidoglycan DD-metalloendopeptidase family protein [Oscillibacter sp.]|nr:peptidoglycan DD-metalloendopeptidase family protein [Oscillibacter sp.]
MKQKKNWIRCVCAAFLAATLLAVNLLPAAAVTKADIDALKGDAQTIAQEKKELQAKLDALSTEISDNLARKELLDQQISLTENEISNKEDEINTYADLIVQTQGELEVAQAREEAQYELFCKRVRAMEEQGKVDYWSVLFRATNFSDLLGRLDAVNEIMEYDQRVIDDLQKIQAEVLEKKNELETQKSESEAAKAELEVKKSELDKQREDANKLIVQLRAQQADQEDAMDDLSDEADAIQAKIMQLSKQLAAEEAAARAAAAAAAAANGGSSTVTPSPSVQSNPGGYIWPVSSRYITSTMGGRASPGGIGSTNHQGTDIGRVGYTSSIYAAKAGTVIVSTYSKSYGNYVVVSHGSGNTTLYAHMSSRKVNVGQTVKQGDVLGITGSTGNSTGPHLHFEVTENGVRVNPLNDGAEPKKGYLTGYTLSK